MKIQSDEKTPTTGARELCDAGLIANEDLSEIDALTGSFPVRISPAIRALIVDANDPIARQFVPDRREAEIRSWEEADPIGDKTHSPVKGIVHRYPDRVLLKLSTSCPVHCRFCFRKEMIGPRADEILTTDDLDAAFDYVENHRAVWEVILSGGDPLVLSPRRIRDVVGRLDAIAHVAVVRWHSRVPVVSPERVTPDFVAALSSGSKTVYLAVHTNHAREHTEAVREGCTRLRQAGIVLVGQTVLLRGVNDSAGALEELMRSCVTLGIKPYYLHLLDRAIGTSHFRVPLAEAVNLLGSLRGRLSGLCQPTLMLDLPGGHGKVPVPTSGVVDEGGGRYKVTDFTGRTHTYLDQT